MAIYELNGTHHNNGHWRFDWSMLEDMNIDDLEVAKLAAFFTIAM